MLTGMMRCFLTVIVCFLSLASMSWAAAIQAPTEYWEWQGHAFRLTCLPGQDFAVLEPFHLDRMPKQNTKAYLAELAKQGIYAGADMSKKFDDLPLKASCQLGSHRIDVDFTYLSSVDLAIGNDPSNTLSTYRSLQHCQSPNNLALTSLKVDGKHWMSEPYFSHDCLDPQVFRMRIYPADNKVMVCKQSTGGQIEFAPLAMWYSSLSVDADGNPPMPEVTCTSVRTDKGPIQTVR